MSNYYLENIPFNKYVYSKKRLEYDTAFKYANIKPLDALGIGALQSYSFGLVKDAQFAVMGGFDWAATIEVIGALTKKTKLQIGNTPIFDLFRTRLYLIDEVIAVNKLESENLGHAPSIDEQNADIERFNIFKTFPQFDQLSGGDLTKIEDVKELPYLLCFTKLHYEAMKADYREDLILIKKMKQK